jgi:NagD protein
VAKAHLIDMDGVLVHGTRPIPGAGDFIERLRAAGAPFLLLTNNSRLTPKDHAARLNAIGIGIREGEIFTAALATARFLHQQRQGASVYAIGETGLFAALDEFGLRRVEEAPDYVVLGESDSFSFKEMTRAVRLVLGGARFIATNPDVNGPTETGIVPGCGAFAQTIAAATGVKPYFVGKPNPLMMREALDQIGVRAADAVMVGDRMDTDIVGGTEAGMETVLVLTGVTRKEQVERWPYRPTRVLASVAEIMP